MPAVSAFGADDAVRPAHQEDLVEALLLGAVVLQELHNAEAFPELCRISFHSMDKLVDSIVYIDSIMPYRRLITGGN